MDPNIIDVWEEINPEEFQIFEATSEVDGQHILARVVGPAFFPDTTSGNKVRYPKAAWENALKDPDFSSRLNDRLVFGTIGHDPILDDNDIRKGNFSHIVTKAWIGDDNKGQAEYLILNTPPGQILNTIFRAKSKIKVSTKAKGKLESANKTTGVKQVDPKTFKLDRIDFVINPGYKQAAPSLVESQDSNIIQEEIVMENDKVIQFMEAQLKELSESKKITEAQATKIQGELRTLAEAQARSRTIIENYEQLGTVATLTEMAKELAVYKSIGGAGEIQESLEKGDEALSKLTAHVKTLTTMVEAARKKASEAEDDDDDDVKDPDDKSVSLGSKKDVKEALALAKKFIADTKAVEEELGTTSEIKEALNILSEYITLGSPSDIREVFNEAKRIVKEEEEKKIKDLASKHECDEDAVRTMVSSGMSPEDADKVLTSVKATKEGKRKPVKENLSTGFIRGHSVNTQVNENQTGSGYRQPESLAARLMSRR